MATKLMRRMGLLLGSALLQRELSCEHQKGSPLLRNEFRDSTNIDIDWIYDNIITAYIAEYQKECSTDLLYRGKIHDIGPAVSHKAAIVELIRKGMPYMVNIPRIVRWEDIFPNIKW